MAKDYTQPVFRVLWFKVSCHFSSLNIFSCALVSSVIKLYPQILNSAKVGLIVGNGLPVLCRPFLETTSALWECHKWLLASWHSSVVENLPANAGDTGDLGLSPGSGRYPGEGNSLVQFSRSVLSDSLWPHESRHTRPSCPSPTPGVYSNSCPSSRWCHPTISSSLIPFSSCPNPSQH